MVGGLFQSGLGSEDEVGLLFSMLFCARALAYSNIRLLATILAKGGVTGAFELNSKVNRRNKSHKQTPTDSLYICKL